MKRNLAILVPVLASALTLSAQQPIPPPQVPPGPPQVRAQGTAIVTTKPDQVRIDIGVITEAATAQAAAAENARQASAVIADLKRAIGEGADVQTVSYSVNPNYTYPKPGSKPVISGYSAVNIVRATTTDVAGAGKLIDAATRNGANTVRGIEFSLRDEQAVRTKALAEATRNARANAEAMASGAGMKVRQILRIEQNVDRQIQPMHMEMMRSAALSADAAVPTPVESGVIRVEASVAISAELIP